MWVVHSIAPLHTADLPARQSSVPQASSSPTYNSDSDRRDGHSWAGPRIAHAILAPSSTGAILTTHSEEARFQGLGRILTVHCSNHTLPATAATCDSFSMPDFLLGPCPPNACPEAPLIPSAQPLCKPTHAGNFGVRTKSYMACDHSESVRPFTGWAIQNRRGPPHGSG